MISKHPWAVAAGALIIIGGSAAAVAAIPGGYDSGNSSNDVKVPSQYSGINDPALQACMNSKQICNPMAAPALQAVPWASPLAPGASQIGRGDAEAIARTAAGAAAGAATFSAELSGSQAMTVYNISRSSNVDETRPVWIVTVVAPVMTDGGPARLPQVQPYYSAVIDAGTGQITDDCIGCSWLTSDH